MMKVIKVLIIIVVIAIISIIQNSISGKKRKRPKQALMPIIALAFSIATVIIGLNYFDKTYIISSISALLLNTNLMFINLAIIIGFIALKAVLCPLITVIWSSKKLVKATSSGFYEYDDEYSSWFLRKEWVNFRKFFFAIVCGATLSCGLFLGLTWALGAGSFVWMLAFPCAALSVINEIYNFINGQTKEEFEHDVMGDAADSRKVSNYYKVREVFERILPEPLLLGHTGCEFIGKQSPADIIKALKESDDSADRFTAEFFETNGRYKSADADYVLATINLMHRRNVIFLNPFYKDLSLYITLPLINALISGKKCVVVTGRMSACDDVSSWLSDVIKEYSRMNSLWRVERLSDRRPDCEVGILSFPQLFDHKTITANKAFFNETDFILLIEPSCVIGTGQVALSIIAREMHCNDEKPIYCVCDRNVDGLVDTLSHVLHAKITDVVAMPVPRCVYTGMTWDADGDYIRQKLFDKQTRYLGNGIELAAIAVKNQIPNVTWYSETKSPIRDIKWITGQYHPSICRYMNIPSQQKNLYDKIDFVPNLWSSPTHKEHFIIAEDEFCNMYSTMRAYLSRGIDQSFVNVISENYLLRDYMRCNRQMFMSNNDAIPSIVPDYAKTERNTLIKLITMMTYRSVSEDEITEEFHLVGINVKDAFDALSTALGKYTYADNTIIDVKSIKTETEETAALSTYCYSISEEDFDTYFADSLKCAYFILENEKNAEYFIDAKLFSHVTQIVLPGQFVTYDGKYYMVKYVTPQSGVVLRRASDLYDGRRYYRQIRKYCFEASDLGEILSIKTVMDIEIAFIRKSFTVTTTGYLDMQDNHDLRMARLVDFSEDPTVDNYTRKYRNKTLLRINFPNTNERIRFTICLLLSEIFRTVFPSGWQYLAVVTKRPEDIDGMLNYTVYPVEGDVGEDYIYIVEDSDVDLGLLEAIDRNLMKLMEIVADFLEWHLEKMREPERSDPIPSVNSPQTDTKKRSLLVKMFDRIKRIFGVKKEDEIKIGSVEAVEKTGKKPPTPPKDTPEKQEESKDEDFTLDTPKGDSKPEEALNTGVNGAEPKKEQAGKTPDTPPAAETAQTFTEDEFIPDDGENPDIVAIDGTDIFDEDGTSDDYFFEEQFKAIGIKPISKTRYQRDCFLKFGFEEIDGRLQIDETRKYLRVHGWCQNSLTKARKRKPLKPSELDIKTVNHCDFCSIPLSGVSYEKLADGRIRCNECSSSAIVSAEDFKELFYRVLNMMEGLYNIKFNIPVTVRMTDAQTIAKGVGSVFKPSTEVANRVLGYAQRKKGQYSLFIENGSPRLATIDTMVHEMTHIWQYINWNDSHIKKLYGKKQDKDIIYEGMAMWASIQYLYQIGETYYASQQEVLAEKRTDIYGEGFRLFRDKYPLEKDAALLKYSPFSTYPPL